MPIANQEQPKINAFRSKLTQRQSITNTDNKGRIKLRHLFLMPWVCFSNR